MNEMERVQYGDVLAYAIITPEGLLKVSVNEIEATLKPDNEPFSWLPALLDRGLTRMIKQGDFVDFCFKLAIAVHKVQGRYQAMGRQDKKGLAPFRHKGRIIIEGERR
ncbi:MAG: hypothetical protein JRN66_06475 [Nitrososphaerota archaeon]|jgi:hypothetical protein|nr:hypothetical protein [Nitrososphaerota archaeon]